MSGHYSCVYTCKLSSSKEDSQAVEINCLHCKFTLLNYPGAVWAMSGGFDTLQRALWESLGVSRGWGQSQQAVHLQPLF